MKPGSVPVMTAAWYATPVSITATVMGDPDGGRWRTSANALVSTGRARLVDHRRELDGGQSQTGDDVERGCADGLAVAGRGCNRENRQGERRGKQSETKSAHSIYSSCVQRF